jgi:predicted NACHT family NTPase
MAKRSLQASTEGIRKAKQAFKQKGLTQKSLSSQVALETRQPIWKFFNGKPIDRQVFHEICFVLELKPQEIIFQAEELDSENGKSLQNPSLPDSLDVLVQKARSAHYDYIQHQCGTLTCLDIARPVALDSLYVDVNILEEVSSRRWLGISDLRIHTSDNEAYNPNNLDRFGLGQTPQNVLPALEAVAKYSKLLVLGKPGSGKTTFLQYIALNCNRGKFHSNYLPIFIKLERFSEYLKVNLKNTLFTYIVQQFSNYNISEQELLAILSAGRAIILLDSLDEVRDEDAERVVKSISDFDEFFYKAELIITCRFGRLRYKFKGFSEVEIADFTKQQIATFVKKCFSSIKQVPRSAKTSNLPVEVKALTSLFMQELEMPENQQFLELAATPILLNLTCLAFQFLGGFPANRAEIYKQALDLLLLRWDEARGIKRDETYQHLSLTHKIRLLSHLAAINFTQGDYLIPESKIHRMIGDYLRQLPNTPTDPDSLLVDSEAVLKSIEAQHGLLVERARGIYSFSHLTFQEFFTAREIVYHTSSEDLNKLEELVCHIGEKRWREVFLLVVRMLEKPDDLLKLIKKKIDCLTTKHQKLENFFIGLKNKSSTVNAPYHSASIRAFYFTLALPPEHALACDQTLAVALDRQLAGNLTFDLALDLALIHALTLCLTITADIFPQRLSAMTFALDLKHLLKENQSLQKSLQDLKNQLPLPSGNISILRLWWEANGEAWTENLRNLIIGDRGIGQNWQFNQNELQILQQYWDSSKLFLDCLNNTEVLNLTLQESLFLNGLTALCK